MAKKRTRSRSRSKSPKKARKSKRSRSSRGKRKVSKGMKSWTAALKKAGYLKKGSFKKIPKKGSKEYKKVVKMMK